MSDLIDREAAIRKIEPWLYSKGRGESELNVLRAVIAELKSLPPAPRWHRVEDELPQNVANRVLVFCKNGVMYAAHYEGGETDKWYMNMGTWWEEGTGNLTCTHWMPMPEPPKEENDG